MSVLKLKNNFNPVKEETGDVTAKRVIWSSDAVNLAREALGRGKKLVANPFLDGNNVKLLKPDLVFERTDAEISEWLRCKDDIIYFASTYCQLMTPNGIRNIELRDYQRDYLLHLVKNKLSIFLSCRQSGKTTTTAIFILWYLLFNIDKNALVLGNKRKTAVEILDKLKKIYLEIPYFLKPGIYKWNEGQIVLDNGCMCMAESTTENSGISFTFHCVLSDENAHIPDNIAEKFYSNIYPTIIAGKSRFIISSTQNGFNLFYRLWTAAVAGENDYAPFKVDWWQVPDWDDKTNTWVKRTEEWKNKQIANLGGIKAFNAQFGTSFEINSASLVSVEYLNKIKPRVVRFVNKELPGILNSDSFYWKPGFEPVAELKKIPLIITCDLAEGSLGDYTVFNFWRINAEHNLKNTLECVGFFRSNTKTIEESAFSLVQIICEYCDNEHLLLSWEKNTYGDFFWKCLLNVTENQKYNKFDLNCFIKDYKDNTYKNYNYGFRVTGKSKLIDCMEFKNRIERGIIINNSELFYIELEKFGSVNSGESYRALFGHDDLVMASVQLVRVMQTIQYKILIDEINIQNRIGNHHIEVVADDMTFYDLNNLDNFYV